MKNNRVSSIRSPEFSPPAARKHKGDETSSGIVHVLHSHLHSDENQYQRSVYLDTAYMRKKITRDMESEDQRNARLAYQRKRSTSNRSNESVDQRNARLTNERERSMSNRSSESVDQRISRLTNQQERSMSNRSNESVDQRDARLTNQRERSMSNRSSESVDQRDARLTNQRERSMSNRSNESVDQRDARLTNERERSMSNRSNESVDQRDARLTNERERSMSNRSNESVDQRDARLTNERERSMSNRSNESVDQRDARLTNQRERSMSNRSNESVDQRDARLTNQRKRSASNRSNKSVQRKSARLMLRQQHSEVTESTDERQHIVEQNQIKNIQHQQRVLEKKHQLLLEQYNWPAVIPTQLKEYCLQDFCNHTSMSALRQSICIVCNIRASVTTMKEYALPNIPNSEKLSCHADLIDITLKTLQTAQSRVLTSEITFANTSFSIDEEGNSCFCSLSNAVFYKKGYNTLTKTGNICQECYHALNKDKVPIFSAANKMWIGDVPLALQQLTIAEEKL